MHLASRQEQAVDLETGAVAAVTGGAGGEATSVQETVATAAEVPAAEVPGKVDAHAAATAEQKAQAAVRAVAAAAVLSMGRDELARQGARR